MADDCPHRTRFGRPVLRNGDDGHAAVNDTAHLQVAAALVDLNEAMPPEDAAELAAGELAEPSQP